MKSAYFAAFLLLGAVSSVAMGQAYTSKGVIRYAKSVDVAKFDPSLSHQSLDEWLRSGPPHLDIVKWAVSDCDLKPPDDQVYRDWPLCAKFWFGRQSKIGYIGGFGLVDVGTTKKGISGPPQLRMFCIFPGTLYVGKALASKRLSDLPSMLDQASATFHKR